MAIIARHDPTGDHYVLLGPGYSNWATARPSLFFGNLVPAKEQGQARLVCLCDANGKIEWAYDKYVTIISIDDQSPADALAGYKTRNDNEES